MLELVHHLDPVLYQETKRFVFTNPPYNPIELANNLIETMIKNNGLGLSANQVGIPFKVFVMWSKEPMAIFNPSIVDTSSKEVLLDEGCLSFPNLHLPIKRPEIIKVRYQDFTGEFKTEKFIGMTARVFQHEFDHLMGIDYTKRANKFHLDRALRKQKILNRQSGKQTGWINI